MKKARRIDSSRFFLTLAGHLPMRYRIIPALGDNVLAFIYSAAIRQKNLTGKEVIKPFFKYFIRCPLHPKRR